MILSDKQILEAIESDNIVIDPFDKNQIQPASYDLRVGKQGATTSTKRLVDIESHGYLEIITFLSHNL